MSFRETMLSGRMLAGTFVKTPSIEIIELLSLAGLDFICLDAEHAPFDRGRMDQCLAMARALKLPALVRVGAGTPQDILQALDSGATGIVVPHVDTVQKAEEMARAARFGLGGRGYAGSTRWAEFTTQGMEELLAASREETVVIAQIEEPSGVVAADQIAAVAGIDGLFLGPADLSVGYGRSDQSSAELFAALESVGRAAQAQQKAYMTFVPNAARAAEWAKYGLTMFFVASEQSWIIQGAAAEVRGIHDLREDS